MAEIEDGVVVNTSHEESVSFFASPEAGHTNGCILGGLQARVTAQAVGDFVEQTGRENIALCLKCVWTEMAVWAVHMVMMHGASEGETWSALKNRFDELQADMTAEMN